MKTALIWGAGGGIGRALVTQLAGDGWSVYAVVHRPGDRDLANLTSHVFDADVGAPFEVQSVVTSISQETGAIDLSVYSVGDIASVKVADMPPDSWQRLVDANLTGAYLTTRYSLPLLSPDAHLVFVGAISERLRLPGLAAYAAAKAGLEAFVEALGKEERGRRVTLLRPAAVNTPFWNKVPFRMPGNALPPETVARRILEAYEQGHKGILDLS